MFRGSDEHAKVRVFRSMNDCRGQGWRHRPLGTLRGRRQADKTLQYGHMSPCGRTIYNAATAEDCEFIYCTCSHLGNDRTVSTRTFHNRGATTIRKLPSQSTSPREEGWEPPREERGTTEGEGVRDRGEEPDHSWGAWPTESESFASFVVQ